MRKRWQNLPTEAKNLIVLAAIFVFAVFVAPLLFWWRQETSPFVTAWQRQHNRSCCSIAFSPERTFLASAGGFDGVVKLWRVADGQLVRTLKAQGGAYSIAFSPDGKLLACGGVQIDIWRVSDNRLVRSMMTDWVWKGIREWVSSVAFSPDGEILASGGWEYLGAGSPNGTIKIWRVTDGKLIRTFKLSHPVSSVSFSPNGAVLASDSSDGVVRLWRVSDGQLMRILKGDVKRSHQVAFSPDGEILVAGSWNVYFWQVANARLVRTLKGHKWGSFVAFSPDGKFLASGGRDGTVKLWRVVDGQLVGEKSMKRHWRQLFFRTPVCAIAFSPDGHFLAIGDEEGTVHLLRVQVR